MSGCKAPKEPTSPTKHLGRPGPPSCPLPCNVVYRVVTCLLQLQLDCICICTCACSCSCNQSADPCHSRLQTSLPSSNIPGPLHRIITVRTSIWTRLESSSSIPNCTAGQRGRRDRPEPACLQIAFIAFIAFIALNPPLAALTIWCPS